MNCKGSGSSVQPLGVYPTRPTGVWTHPGIAPMHTPPMGQMGSAAARADEGPAPQWPMQQHNSPAKATRRMRDPVNNRKASTMDYRMHTTSNTRVKVSNRLETSTEMQPDGVNEAIDPNPLGRPMAV